MEEGVGRSGLGLRRGGRDEGFGYDLNDSTCTWLCNFGGKKGGGGK